MVIRFTVRSGVEAALALVLGLSGFSMLVSTIDEFKAGRAFTLAMNKYSARLMEDVHEALNKATAAKPSYTAPQEAIGKLLIDEGQGDPAKYAEAKRLFEDLGKLQESEGRQPSLPVLIGLAVADLEVVRSQKPSADALRRAVAEARSRLEKARDQYPDSGDVYANLATVALLSDNAAVSKEYLGKVRAVGNISVDALPFLYNLKGLAALRDGSVTSAVEEFEKVKEFAPDWEVPRLNLAAAYAESLQRGNLDPRTAERYASAITNQLGSFGKSKSPLIPLICHGLAIHNMRLGEVETALYYFGEAEKAGPLSWHARFNRAVAHYLAGKRPRATPAQRVTYLQQAREELERAVKSQLATRRDTFVASCILGTLDAEQDKVPSAIAHFERAAQAAPRLSDPSLQKAVPILHRSLAALLYKTGRYKEALGYLEKYQAMGEKPEKGERPDAVATLLTELRTAPKISHFSANVEKILTDYDLRVSAQVEAPPTAQQPITAENVRLTLTNEVTGTLHPMVTRFAGSQFRALAINLPQGRYQLKLQVTDTVGNSAPAATKEFTIDREPPRVLKPEPAGGTTVKRLDTVGFRVQDTIGTVDLSSLSVVLQYPAGGPHSNRWLVSRGKCIYSSSDGAIKAGMQVADDVQCPVPEPAPPGTYTVTVTARDDAGKTGTTTWSFTLRP